MTWEIDPAVIEREKERTEDYDRAARESIADFLSDSGSSSAGTPLDGDGGSAVAADGKPTRTRKLRATFRSTPSSDTDPGFPGTRTFSPYSSNRREVRSTLQAKGAGPDISPAPVASPDDSQGRRAALQPAGGDASANRPTEPAAASPGRRGLRGRPKGSKTGKTATVTPASDKAGAKEKPAESSSAKSAAAFIGTIPDTDEKLSSKPDKSASPSAPKYIPTESERADARRLFREIGERFNQNRKKSKASAYAAYRHDLMANLDTLIMGGAIDLKEVTTVITGLEQYTKETEAESTETPATILGKWLRMDAVETSALEVKPLEVEETEPVEDEEEAPEEG